MYKNYRDAEIIYGKIQTYKKRRKRRRKSASNTSASSVISSFPLSSSNQSLSTKEIRKQTVSCYHFKCYLIIPNHIKS